MSKIDSSRSLLPQAAGVRRKVIHVIDSLDVGGAQEIVYSLARYVKSYWCLIVALHGRSSGGYASKIEPHAGVRVLSESKLNLPKIAARLKQTVMENRNDIFNFHLESSTVLGGILRRLVNFQAVVSVHAHPAQFRNWKRSLFYQAAGSADCFVAEDRDVIEHMRLKGIAPERIFYIPIGSEKITKIKRPDRDVRKEFGIPRDRMLLLNIGRMVPPKGQRDLVYAMKELRKREGDGKAHLVIVGDGPERNSLECLTEKLGVQNSVTMPGKRMDLHNFYAEADCFIMPCHDESMGVVIYEALGYGVPVIAYHSGSIHEIISNENRGILTPKDYMSLADTILNCDVKVMKRRLQNEDLSFFKAERMAEDYERLYDDLQSRQCWGK